MSTLHLSALSLHGRIFPKREGTEAVGPEFRLENTVCVFGAYLGIVFHLLEKEQHCNQETADDINIKDKEGSCQTICWEGQAREPR